MQSTVRLVVMRGGTSRALIFREEDLPADRESQDAVLRAAMGSPDPFGRQIDGLGGATSVTSKVAIVGPSKRPDADVDFTFAQVAIDKPIVDRRGTCGNISSAIGPFAVDEGMVPARTPTTDVRVFNTNTGKMFIAHVPTAGGRFDCDGDFSLPGIPGTGAPVVLDFLDPTGAVTGRPLPSGSPRDRLEPAVGEAVEVSIVDAANPLVFVRLADVGLSAEAQPEEMEADEDLMARLEAIRAAAGVAAGLAGSAAEATRCSPAVPKLALVGPPASYRRIDGTALGAGDVDLVLKSLTMGTVHRAFQLSGGICTATAAAIPGTLVHDLVHGDAARTDGTGRLRLGHPSGVMVTETRAGHVSVVRTARRLMEGIVYVPSAALAGATAA